jgi:hypothetical protein
MEFIEAHFAAFLCLAYTGIAAWLVNKLLIAVSISNTTRKF